MPQGNSGEFEINFLISQPKPVGIPKNCFDVTVKSTRAQARGRFWRNSFPNLASPYFQLREKFYCLEHTGLFKISFRAADILPTC